MFLRNYEPALMQGAKINTYEILNLNNTTGNIYFAKKSTDSDYNNFIADNQVTYRDGTTAVYNTIQACADAATDKRGDVVFVAAGDYSSSSNKWKENVIITKAGLKVFAIEQGWETQMRPGDATTKYPLAGDISVSGFAFLIMARSVELAGFLCDGGGGYGGVYVGDGVNVTGSGKTGSGGNSASAWVHDMNIRGGGEGTYGVVLEGCSSHVLIENNIFDQWANSAIYLAPGGGRTCQYPIIRRNEFFAANGGYGIDMYAATSTIGTLIRENSFRDGSSLAFANPIRVPSGASGVTSIVGNYFACTNEPALQTTDWMSGNQQAKAGAAAAANYFVTIENPT